MPPSRRLPQRLGALLLGVLLPLLFSQPSQSFAPAPIAASAPLSTAAALSTSVADDPLAAAIAPAAPGSGATGDGASLDQRAREAYQSALYERAGSLWQQAAEAYRQASDPLRQARALSNLALCQHHVGRSEAADQTIAASLQLLSAPSKGGDPAAIRTLAQATNTLARLQLASGRTLDASRSWLRSASLYGQAGDQRGADAALVNQAEALQQLGHLREARLLLEPLVERLRLQPPSALRAMAQLSLAATLQRQGDLQAALSLQQDSRAIAAGLGSDTILSAAHQAIANSQRLLGHTAAALAQYQRAQRGPASSLARLQAGSSQLSLLLDTYQYSAAARLWPGLLSAAAAEPASRPGLEASFHLAGSLLRLRQLGPALPAADRPDEAAIRTLLNRCLAEATALDDRRSQSVALGDLGQLEEDDGRLAEAARLTDQAIQLAQPLQAQGLLFRWSWQQGRIARRRGDLALARSSYEQAIAAQQQIRQDLVATIPSLQASFRSTVEPLYRQTIDLLTSTSRDNATLQRSRQLIEALQIAELNDYFQQACLQASTVEVDRIDPRAAVIYPILLPDRLEVIVRLPGPDGRLIAHSQPLADGELERTVAELNRVLQVDPIQQQRFEAEALLPPAQRLYDWIVRPFAAELASQGVANLVVVPDAALRSVPMAVLHDRERFLAERYGIAMAPGLQLRAPSRESSGRHRLLLAGISEERSSFPALASVNRELQDLKARMNGTLLLNRAFTRNALQQALTSGDYGVVHLATHGQFSSSAADTFLLAWDQRIPVNDLDALLQPSRRLGGDAIDLLVLSACETAAGDAGANLGLAAMAVRSGASSTLASLWPVNDDATAEFMSAFYNAWQNGRISKVAALRQAQQQLLASSSFQHPYYWAAFSLLGNWM